MDSGGAAGRSRASAPASHALPPTRADERFPANAKPVHGVRSRRSTARRQAHRESVGAIAARTRPVAEGRPNDQSRDSRTPWAGSRSSSDREMWPRQGRANREAALPTRRRRAAQQDASGGQAPDRRSARARQRRSEQSVGVRTEERYMRRRQRSRHAGRRLPLYPLQAENPP